MTQAHLMPILLMTGPRQYGQPEFSKDQACNQPLTSEKGHDATRGVVER
jgi:hypothetical protein